MAVAAGEALRFVEGDEIPVRAFWTRRGLWTLRQNPRGVLEAKAAEYRDAIDEFIRVYGPRAPG